MSQDSLPEEEKHPYQECVIKEERIIPRHLRLLWVLLKRHKWKATIGALLLTGTAYGYYAITKEPAPEYITAAVTRGDLVQTVEAVGTVTSERDLKLQFPVSGVVADVLVKEGDTVEAGERLAALRAGDLSAQIHSASANLQAARADLQELTEGARPEDIVIAEAEVENKRAVLTAAREELVSSEQKLAILVREAEISLSGEVGEARSTVSQQMAKARNALSVFDDVVTDNDVSDALTRGEPGLVSLIEDERDVAKASNEKLLLEGIDFDSREDALRILRLTRSVVVSTSTAIESLFSSLITVPPTSSFTRSEREARKADLTAERNNLQTALTAVDAAIKDLQDASATYDTKIASEQSAVSRLKGDILTHETSLRTQEAQLMLKRAGSRQTEIDVATARVRQAQADLDRARANFSNTVLIAPVSGTVTKVNVKEGELLSTAFQQSAAITMLGRSPYRVEMYIAEVDIPKISFGQQAQVELDAFPRSPFALSVAEIDPAATDVDGVPKYRVRLDFTVPPERLKIGMTGDADIFTGESKDVLMVSARSVIENAEGKTIVRVLQNGIIVERSVETGLEGENDIEIMSGLAEGETVVVLIKK
jgi:HlyD family secretion protein